MGDSHTTSEPAESSNYTVVARRYRPRSFAELIGQEHIAQALDKAISTGRVGHAYLFTGARGVGKTSSARIFAKVLNTPAGTDQAVAEDISRAIDQGEDMDVIEIDGASNRGIEEIRQLRANVNVRPSRSRYKIYIIDEVHMLTNQAFNALLKTLEEPPPHVKFIFCTTDPDKLPITVLSRCQRFDFVPIKLDAIQTQLQEICQAEGFEADADALGLLARRAAGSMRDSQSLLEQVMSFSTGSITVDQVQRLLGIADEASLLALTEALAEVDALAAISKVDESVAGGADPGQLSEQLLNYLRDLMAVAVGGGPGLLKLANPAGHARLQQIAQRWGIQSILASIQILDESLARMRTSVSPQALLEVALVQICQVQQLASIPALIEMLSGEETMGEGRPRTAEQKAAPKPSAAADAITFASGISAGTGTTATPRSSQPAEKKKLEATADKVTDPSRLAAEGFHVDVVASPTIAQDSAVCQSEMPAESNRVADHANDTNGAHDLPDSVRERIPVSSHTETAGFAARNLHADQDRAEQADSVNTAAHVAPAAIPQPAIAGDRQPESGDRTGSVTALEQWKKAVGTIDGMLADYADLAIAVSPRGSDHWEVVFPPGSQRTRDYCDQSDRKAALGAAVHGSLGRPIQLTFLVKPGEAPPVAAAPPAANRVQKMREIAENPFVKKFCDTIDGEIVRVDPPSTRPVSSAATASMAVHKML